MTSGILTGTLCTQSTALSIWPQAIHQFIRHSDTTPPAPQFQVAPYLSKNAVGLHYQQCRLFITNAWSFKILLWCYKAFLLEECTSSSQFKLHLGLMGHKSSPENAVQHWDGECVVFRITGCSLCRAESSCSPMWRAMEHRGAAPLRANTCGTLHEPKVRRSSSVMGMGHLDILVKSKKEGMTNKTWKMAWFRTHSKWQHQCFMWIFLEESHDECACIVFQVHIPPSWFWRDQLQLC